MIRLFFVVLVLIVAIAWVSILWRAKPDRRGITAAGMMLWLLFTAGMAFSGILQNFHRVPPPMGILIMGAFLLTAALAWSSYGAGSLDTTLIPLIVGFQVFRVGVEVFLWWGVQTGLVPPQLSFEGRNWDILTGLSALPVAWLFSRGTIPKTVVAIWNVLGLALLLNVMIVAALSIPTPAERFEPASRFVTTLPYVWLPALLVQAAWFSHLVLFRLLWKKKTLTI